MRSYRLKNNRLNINQEKEDLEVAVGAKLNTK